LCPSFRNPDATDDASAGVEKRRKYLRENGEPGGNRTPNPQIKSLLLCQLSYRPGEMPILARAKRPTSRGQLQ
jgi:hypothetical protein